MLLASLAGDQYAHVRSIIDLPPSMRIGAEEIDKQHRHLMTELSALRSSPDLPISSEIVGEISMLMGRDLLKHFLDEEAFMQQTAMPESMLATHIDEHDRIIREYVDFQNTIMASPAMKVKEVIDTIEGWITSHIVDWDLPIKRYL